MAPSLGDLAVSGTLGLAASSDARTVSLAQPTKPRVVSAVKSLVPVQFFSAGLGPHLGATAGSSLVQLNLVSDLAAPLPVDAVDLYPATSLADVAVEGNLVAATINAVVPRSGATDALALVEVPFPIVVGSTPRAGATGVRVSEPITLEMSVPLHPDSKVQERFSVRLLKLNGSADGAPVDAPWRLNEARTAIILDPSQDLDERTSYRVVAQGLVSASGAVMPGRFVAEFETSTSADRVPVTLICPVMTPEGLRDCVEPRQGPVVGDTLVTLRGTGFEPGLEVRFGGTAAKVVEVASDRTWVRVRTPAGAAGAASLEVRNPSGGSLMRLGAYLYTEALSLASITPDRGPTSGGTRVVLEGTGFATDRPMDVFFGTQRALRVRTLGMGRLEAYTPNGLRGPVAVTVVRPAPDGATVTREGFYTFDQPTDSALAFSGEIRDVLVIGDAIYTVGAQGLRVVDLSNLYTRGPLAGIPIPPERRTELIDEDRDRVDDRIIGRWDSQVGELLSLAYPVEGGDRLFVGAGRRNAAGEYAVATVMELDISNPAQPRLVSSTPAGAGAVFGLDARGDRLLAAAGAGGLRGYDISHAPFLLNTRGTPIAPDTRSTQATALAVEGGRAVLGTGVWTQGHRFTQGRLHLLSVERLTEDAESAPLVLGSVELDVQRVRMYRGWAVVAAGDAGLVLVELTGEGAPTISEHKVGKEVLGGFASDVRLVGSLAYVAVGEAGVAVVDLSNLEAPKLLYHVTGARGGAARTVAVAGAVSSACGSGRPPAGRWSSARRPSWCWCPPAWAVVTGCRASCRRCCSPSPPPSPRRARVRRCPSR